MKYSTSLHSSFVVLALVACSSSAEEGQNDSLSDDPSQFITKEEASAAAANDGETSSPADVDVDVDTPPAGIQGSGVVVAEDDKTSWIIPNDGSSFTGPPLQAGEGPESANGCPNQQSIVTTTESVGEQICFYSAEDPATPAARIDQVIESVEGEDFVRIRLTLSPNFVDNSYGETAVGWGPSETEEEMVLAGDMPMEGDVAIEGEMPMEGGKMPKPPKKPKGAKTHTFDDLVGSDHAEIQLTDADGSVALHFKVDYLSEDPDAPSGYASLGVLGGEGKMIVGDASWILEATTSMDRNMNACGYAEFTENSPVPPRLDAEAEAENWDYRVVYEVWVSLDAFGEAGFGEASIEFVHASPSKASSNTVEVTSGPCPPDEPPGDEGVGGNGSGGSGTGSGGAAGGSSGGAGGSSSGVLPEEAR